MNPVIRSTLATFTSREKTVSEIDAAIAGHPGCHLVAEHGGRVSGYACFGPFRAGPGYAHTAEHTIYLAPETQGRGLGRELMARLEAQAAQAGIHVLVAGISSANPAAAAFHAALGYREVGRLPETGRKAGQWLDLVLMQKILPAATQQDPDTPGPKR